jgi:predicted phage replisome organizer
MAEVKWIKLNVGMFDGNSFKRIKKAKIGGESFRDKLTAVWFELMDFAGKCNAGGLLIESQEIPFASIEDIATLIDREPEELELCMQFYINNRMITVIDDVYMLSNWSKYQNEDGLEKIREQTRKRVAKHRENQKLLSCNVTGNATVTQGNATDIDIELDIDKDLEEDNILSDSKPKKSKSSKHKYGEYSNVLLTDEELDKLKAEYTDWEERIERLSSYVASTGKSYKSHYATIRNWARKDAEKPQVQAKKNKFNNFHQREYDADAYERAVLCANLGIPVESDPELKKEAEELQQMLKEKY